MGQLILCMGKPASEPYYMESASVNIYSLEEMSYYLIRNTDFIDTDFMCAEFCDWVRDEMRQEELADQLSDWLKQEVPLYEFSRRLLTYIGYATSEEMKETENLLKQFETKDELERHKIRADRFLRRGKYTVAIEKYIWILENFKEETRKDFLGNVWHNLGVAYAGNFLFAHAAEAFHKAYEWNTNPESMKEEILSLILSDQKGEIEKRAREYELGEEALKGYMAELEEKKDRAKVNEASEKIKMCYTLYKERQEETSVQEIRGMVKKWKQAYRA
ncbi:MAG: hypothetical protein HFI37_05655 [Lachnospiraceae bacterium]|nr:hypothetical protein [Lachnospiraceae bacterium]